MTDETEADDGARYGEPFDSHDDFLTAASRTLDHAYDEIDPDVTADDVEFQPFDRVTSVTVILTGIEENGAVGSRSESHMTTDMDVSTAMLSIESLNESLCRKGVKVGFRDALSGETETGGAFGAVGALPIDLAEVFGMPDHGMDEHPDDEPDGHGVY